MRGYRNLIPRNCAMVEGSHHRFRMLLALCVGTLFVGAMPVQFPGTMAQSAAPILISHHDSTRALSFESVTRHREPFAPTVPVAFGADNKTRVMLFAMNLTLQAGDSVSSITVTAEDGAHHVYQLPVEYIGSVPEQPWATAVVVRLSNDLTDLGDVLVGLSYRGAASNRVRVAMGHVGGGLADDAGAVPTPGSAIPNAPGATAGNLTTGDVQTIISQAVSAAVGLNRAVTVSVTDREANVLGVFVMTGAPATTTIRSVGTLGQGLEGNCGAGDFRRDFQSRNRFTFQHHRQRIHDAHGRLHHPGTLSAGHRVSFRRPFVRRAVFVSSLL